VDSEGEGWKEAGLRETAEEVGVYLTDRPIDTPDRPLRGEDVYLWVLARGARFDARRLTYLSNWVTPRPAPQRFDARFFVAKVEGTEKLSLSPTELTEWVWIRPADALDRFRLGEWDMILPTEKNLECLLDYSNSHQAWTTIDQTGEVHPVLPRMVFREQGLDALLPGDPGYEEEGE
jgi:8-oxo-dGTP pyrophosphatase MutT (NUDIX family)